jgi:protein TonB
MIRPAHRSLAPDRPADSSYNVAHQRGVRMFDQSRPSNRRWNTSLVVSFVVHLVIIFFVARPPHPIFINTPTSVAFGHGGLSTELVYLTQRGANVAGDSASKPEPPRIALKSKARSRPKAAPAASPVTTATDRLTTDQDSRAGSPFGSLAQGLTTGHDVRPALPMVFPNPGILPWQIPSGVEGTVIVEVTIDAQGNVTDTRVLQGLGHGIEDKVVAALRNWRFRPAMIDGRAIASQQDVYFHFPT